MENRWGEMTRHNDRRAPKNTIDDKHQTELKTAFHCSRVSSNIEALVTNLENATVG